MAWVTNNLYLTECADSIKIEPYVTLPCGFCHVAPMLSAQFTWEGKCLIRDKRVVVCVMQDRAVIPTLCGRAQLPGWAAVSLEDGLQYRCTYLGVLARSADYWCTVGSFAAVVYFTSCGYIPVVVVSGTAGLLSVMRAYWIMPPLDSQRSFVANKHLDKTG